MNKFITITSDFGKSSHYLAILKAGILSKISNIKIIEICNEIKNFDIEEGAYLLKNTYKNFPNGSIHIFTIENDYTKHFPIIAEIDNHFFIGANNGFIGLIEKNKINRVIKIKFNQESSHFLNEIGKCAAKLANGQFYNLEEEIKDYKLLYNNNIRKNKNNIIGKILYIDNYGNLITNIDKSSFEKWSFDNNFKISVGFENFYKINNSCSNVDPGSPFCIFNSSNLLEIGIYYGDASKLLGMQKNSPVVILKKN
ncbi:MAG: SAM-dependent chlorinase/fluorinase [Bacteroidetes bacterium]|nr:SAM-dependent chlorinase/fluorinase [Bacteroidota bacterium]